MIYDGYVSPCMLRVCSLMSECELDRKSSDTMGLGSKLELRPCLPLTSVLDCNSLNGLSVVCEWFSCA